VAIASMIIGFYLTMFVAIASVIISSDDHWSNGHKHS
jgi:hypothetical protein